MTNQVVLLEVHLPLGRPLHGVFQVFLKQSKPGKVKSLFFSRIQRFVNWKSGWRPKSTWRQSILWVFSGQVHLIMIFYCILFVTGEYVKHLNVTTGLRRTKVWRKVLHILKMPLNQSNIIGLPCKNLNIIIGGFWENIIFAFCNGVIFTRPFIFRRFLADISETVRLR